MALVCILSEGRTPLTEDVVNVFGGDPSRDCEFSDLSSGLLGTEGVT